MVAGDTSPINHREHIRHNRQSGIPDCSQFRQQRLDFALVMDWSLHRFHG